jgi:hypothetical protein
VSVKEKILSKDEELSASEEPLLLDKDYNPENIVNTSSSIEDDLERQLASFLEKEEAFKKNDITQKELIKKYEEEIKELKNLNQQYDKKIKNEIIQEVSNFFKKQKQRNTLKIIVDQQLEFKKLQKSINYLKENNKLLEASNLSLKSNLVKIAELEKDLKNKKNELAKQKQLEGKIDIFEKRISDTEKEIETQSLIENRIAQLEKGFVSSKQETNKKEDINIDKTGEIKEIKIDENLKNDLSNAKNWDLSEEAIERELSQIKNSKYDVEQEKLRTSEIIREQEKQLKSLYEEKSELNQNMLDFQKNKNHLQSEFIYKQKELIKKYEDEIKEFQNLNKINNEKLVNLEEKNNDLNNKEDELKNLNQKSNEKILDLKETNKNLKNKDDKIKHYQNDNLRLSKELFENSKKLEDHKIQINKFENNKSQIQEQIYNLNKIISKNNIVKNHFDLFSQNKDVQNISKITVKEKPDIELTTNHENVEEKNKVLEELNLKTKDIFAK